MPDLLIELFSEEIPARMQARAREDLRKLVTDGLVEAGLTYASAGAFSTPRRLALSIEGLTAESHAVREERKGPRSDAPPAALEGFLRSTSLTKDQLELRDEKKGQVYFAVIEKPGRPAAVIVAEVLERVVRDFPWPKAMRWGSGTLRWVRPLHSILCILTDEGGAQVVPLTIDGIEAGATTKGHRFMAPAAFSVTNFDDYHAKLKRAFVVLDSAEREAAIWHDATTAAFAQGLEVAEDQGLLTEVAGLVEWPVMLMGAIPERFLDLPPEVLQTSMKEHQKFFSVKNPKTGRIEKFITVANRETSDDGETILKGNLKVLSARLSDAKFFWENDLRIAKAGMEEWAEGLKSVTFHNKLGSQSDRIARIAALAREIAPLVGADPDQAERAAKLAKLDLRSAMVGEFPELQGTMGRYYALAANEPAAIADAARDHWRPKGEGDQVPTEPVSVAVALADKVDTLTGFWAIDEKPTGSKDPFALRRAALGVVRLALTNSMQTQLRPIFESALERHYERNRKNADIFLFGVRGAGGPLIMKIGETFWDKHPEGMDYAYGVRWSGDAEAALVAWRSGTEKLSHKAEDHRFYMLLPSVVIPDILSFLHDRLKVYLRDQGIRHDVVDLYFSIPDESGLSLRVKLASALSMVLKTEDGANLIQGFKRANNILTQAEEKDGVEYSYGADVKFAETDDERALFAALDRAEAAIAPAMAAEDFPAAMSAMAALRGPIDAFFTSVQVNSDKQVIRRNRLNLLHRIRAICGQVADLTRIEG